MKTLQFYIWKPSINFSSDTIGTCDKNTYTDTWLVYDGSKSVVTNTCELTFLDIRAYIYTNNSLKSRRRTHIEIITAAPNNLSDFPEIENLEYDSSLAITGLKFDDLKKRHILFIRSQEDYETSVTEDLSVDIFYKKIFDQPVNRVLSLEERKNKSLGQLPLVPSLTVDTREYLKKIEIWETQILKELKSKFSDVEFKTGLTSYYTYSVVPACGRSFEELYEDCLEIEENERDLDLFL